MIKKLRSALLKTKIRLFQRKYKRLTYLFQRGTSKTLVVSFSGFAGVGPARYNYINTLKDLDAHRLFILDDFGYQKCGSYYLGEQGEWFLPPMVMELIRKIQQENGINRIITVGSSKGGTAALFYGIQLKADCCIIGAPQYHCGDYLNIPKHLPILEGIMGTTDQSAIDKMNQVFRECICNPTAHHPEVYIHYSPKEHTYWEHIADLIADLKKYGYPVAEDAGYTYTDHGDVAKHFPGYLLKVLQEKL